MPKGTEQKLKPSSTKELGLEVDSEAATPSPTPSLPTDLPGQDTSASRNVAGSSSSARPTISDYAPAHPTSIPTSPSSVGLFQPSASTTRAPNSSSTLGVVSSSAQPQPKHSAAAPVASLRMFEGSTNFEIKNSVLTNAQGNVNIYKFDVGGSLTEEFKTLFIQHIAGSITIKDLDKIEEKMERYASSQAVKDLPRVNAAYDDYTPSDIRHITCFEGTRQALLDEIAQWLTTLDGPRAYLLFGIAGIGKSTVAQTIAEKANNLRLLGASFFFSRDEVERSNAKHFFTTIAFQLCLYGSEFSQAIEKALLTKRGLAAITKDPIIQLEALILEPLRGNPRLLPTLIVVDALDECDNQDALVVLAGLNRLVLELPHFKVMVTTRPEPHLPQSLSSHKVFHLQNIEDKIVDSDIRRYLEYTLSWPQVVARMPNLAVQWSASDHELESLVQAAGRLFIMASTAVRFILDTTIYDPKSQIKALSTAGRVSLDGLGNFYNVILRRAVPPNKPMIAQRFRYIMGTILVVQEPLPIRTLERLTPSRFSSTVRAVLGNLQSVVALNNDMPRIYHKSFYDFLTNRDHCDQDLLIEVKKYHARLAARCIKIMNKYLKQNILGLGTPNRFMNNDAALAAENISTERLAKKIPGELRYACVYWANHIEGANSKDPNLLREVATFIDEHLLHWLEALSWIGKLDVATRTLRVMLKSMKSVSSDLSGIISNALYFIPKFYDRIRRSALHTYYSALAFTPTEALLFERYSKEMTHCLCQPDRVPAQRDALIAQIGWQESNNDPFHVIFSNDSTKFAMRHRQEMRLLNAENGSSLRTFKGDNISIADDFSVAAVSQGCVVTLWNVASNAPVTVVTQPKEIVKLALSSDGSRLALGSSDGTVCVWDTRKDEPIASHVGYHPDQLEFAPGGHRLAFMSDNAVQLCDGHSGKVVARLDYMSRKHAKFTFSRSNCRLASLVNQDQVYSLTLWDDEKGNLIGIAENVGSLLAITEDGSFIATAGWVHPVQLWEGKSLSLVGTLGITDRVKCLCISRGVLAIGLNTLKLYDINKRAFIVTLSQSAQPQSLALSPDCTRLAVGTGKGSSLYDVPSLKTFIPASRPQDSSCVFTVTFSPDSTRLASGCVDGTVQLWDTGCTKQPIATHELHPLPVNTVAFSPAGDQFASGSADKTVRLWDGRDGAPIRQLGHTFTDWVTSVAFSHTLLAAATGGSITLFDRKSLRVVDILKNGARALAFSADGSCLAAAYNHYETSTSDVTMWKVEGQVPITLFKVNSTINNLMFSPDGSKLAAQSTRNDGSFKFFDVVNKQAIEPTGHDDLRWIPNFMNGVLISWGWDSTYGDCLLGQFSGHSGLVPVLWIPRDLDIPCFAVGSSVVALGCGDGRIIFVRF